MPAGSSVDGSEMVVGVPATRSTVVSTTYSAPTSRDTVTV